MNPNIIADDTPELVNSNIPVSTVSYTHLDVYKRQDIPFESTGILPSLEWQKQEFQKRRDRINDRIDKTISNLEKEYQEKIDAAPDNSTKRRLENELKSRIRSWEQQRKQELAHYTTWHDWDSYNTGIGQGYNEYLSLIHI